jgi:hypothetical protein
MLSNMNPEVIDHVRVALTRVQRGTYLLEALDLVSELLGILSEMKRTSAAWQDHGDSLDVELPDQANPDRDRFAALIRAKLTEHREYFASLEAFLGGWARLSLLFFPSHGDISGAKFRAERAEELKRYVGVGDESALADRELRNAWMHFDERLDAAMLDGSFRERQRFVSSSRSAQHVGSTLRLMEMDTLVVYYRDHKGGTRRISLRDLEPELRDLYDRILALIP